MNDRFPVLSALSVMLRVVGWVLAIGAALYGFTQGVLEPAQPGHVFAAEDLLQLTTGIAGLVLGLITAALGESIGVLFAIEKNTRKE